MTDQINGAAPCDPTIIQLLEQTLAQARSGRLQGVLIIRVPTPGTNEAVAAGNGLMEMYVGAGLAMRRIEGAMATAAQPKVSPILRAANLPPGM